VVVVVVELYILVVRPHKRYKNIKMNKQNTHIKLIIIDQRKHLKWYT